MRDNHPCLPAYGFSLGLEGNPYKGLSLQERKRERESDLQTCTQIHQSARLPLSKTWAKALVSLYRTVCREQTKNSGHVCPKVIN